MAKFNLGNNRIMSTSSVATDEPEEAQEPLPAMSVAVEEQKAPEGPLKSIPRGGYIPAHKDFNSSVVDPKKGTTMAVPGIDFSNSGWSPEDFQHKPITDELAMQLAQDGGYLPAGYQYILMNEEIEARRARREVEATPVFKRASEAGLSLKQLHKMKMREKRAKEQSEE